MNGGDPTEKCSNGKGDQTHQPESGCHHQADTRGPTQLKVRRIANQKQKGQGKLGLAFILKHCVGSHRLPGYGSPGSLVAPPDAIGALTESI